MQWRQRFVNLNYLIAAFVYILIQKSSQHFYSVGMGLLFEVVVTHSKQVISVKGSYYSTVNDKNSVKCSNFISDLNNKDIYKDISYKVKTGLKEQDFVEISNCYVIADGGYLEWPATITGFPGISSDPAEYKFTDWVASVRKDVESFFGILKKRFVFFKNPITLQSIEDIDNAFYTACINHLSYEIFHLSFFLTSLM